MIVMANLWKYSQLNMVDFPMYVLLNLSRMLHGGQSLLLGIPHKLGRLKIHEYYQAKQSRPVRAVKCQTKSQF